MQEKFRLRSDLNEISLTDAEMIALTDALEKYDTVKAYHRYHYLFKGYHDLAHGKIDDEAFFTLGDISSDRPVFATAPGVSLEALFLIEEDIAHSTLYIVEQSASSYYNGKSKERAKLEKLLAEHNSKLLVI